MEEGTPKSAAGDMESMSAVTTACCHVLQALRHVAAAPPTAISSANWQLPLLLLCDGQSGECSMSALLGLVCACWRVKGRGEGLVC